MSYPINYPKPQGANIQTFNAGQTTGTQTWVKPQGASFVWFTLIGPGGGGGGTDNAASATGGGSGAVTNCLVPAFLIPDELQIQVGKGGAGGASGTNDGASGTNTTINYTSKATYTLLTANSGSGGIGDGATTNGGAGGVASTSNYFSAMGFFQSIAGQDGSPNGGNTASSTTFLGGGGNDNTNITNYGYSTTVTSSGISAGYFMTQPIIVGIGGNSILNFSDGTGSVGGIGCGGGGASAAGNVFAGGNGGNGLVIIISW